MGQFAGGIDDVFMMIIDIVVPDALFIDSYAVRGVPGVHITACITEVAAADVGI